MIRVCFRRLGVLRNQKFVETLISEVSRSPSRSAILWRIISGISANSFAYAAASVLQLITVPVLLNKWGVETYGAWIVIASIGMYLNLCDFGYSATVGNAIATELAHGNKVRARALFESLWFFVGIVSIAILVVAITMLVIGLEGFGDGFMMPIAVVAAQSAIGLNALVFQAGFRAAGLFAKGIFFQSLLRSSCDASVLLVAVAGGGLFAAALGVLTVMIVGAFWMGLRLRASVDWIDFSWSGARWSLIWELKGVALASQFFPISFALTLQGIPVLIAMFESANAVAIFNTTRTMTRLVLQATTIVTHSLAPEYAHLARNKLARQKLFFVNLSFVAVAGLLALGVIVLLGDKISSLWTGGRIVPNRYLLVLLSLTALAQILNNVFFNALIGINQHKIASMAIFFAALFTIVIAYALIPTMGLDGAGYALLVPEIALAVIVWAQLARAGIVGSGRTFS